MNQKRGQIGTEYLIIISFVVFAVLTTLGIALVYTANIKDSIKLSQLDKAAKKIIYASETTFYDGERALSTVEVFFPEGIKNTTIYPKEIVFEISTQTGVNKISYGSNVPLQGDLTLTPSGLRKVKIRATSSYADISLV